MPLIFLGVLDDFCSWWYLWWILPFLLGILLGAALWGGAKSSVTELENSNLRLQGALGDIEKQHSQIKDERDKCMNNSSKLEKQNTELSDKVTLLNKKLLESRVKADQLKAKSQQVAPIPIPASKKNAASAQPKGTPNYGKLKSGNLQIIEGIGPKIESILKENGIKSWRELSTKSKGELKALLESYGPRYTIINPTGWPQQALKAADKDWNGLIKLQKADGSASKLEKIMQKLGLA